MSVRVKCYQLNDHGIIREENEEVRTSIAQNVRRYFSQVCNTHSNVTDFKGWFLYTIESEVISLSMAFTSSVLSAYSLPIMSRWRRSSYMHLQGFSLVHINILSVENQYWYSKKTSLSFSDIRSTQSITVLLTMARSPSPAALVSKWWYSSVNRLTDYTVLVYVYQIDMLCCKTDDSHHVTLRQSSLVAAHLDRWTTMHHNVGES